VRYARIDLVGTAPAARRQGVFDALVAETARRARPDAGALVLVSKLDNYPVQAALARLGFRLVSAEHALHRTRPAEGGA
jgi:ribosomal protein S18 acetylase RimI-like enzyme